MHKFNAQMNTTPKIDEFAKKCIFLGALQKWVEDALFKFPMYPSVVLGIIKIAQNTDAHGPKTKASDPSPQSGLSRNMSLGKESKKFGPSYHHKGQAKRKIFYKGGNQEGKPPNVGNKEGGFVVPRQIMFVPKNVAL